MSVVSAPARDGETDVPSMSRPDVFTETRCPKRRTMLVRARIVQSAIADERRRAEARIDQHRFDAVRDDLHRRQARRCHAAVESLALGGPSQGQGGLSRRRTKCISHQSARAIACSERPAYRMFPQPSRTTSIVRALREGGRARTRVSFTAERPRGSASSRSARSSASFGDNVSAASR